MKFKEIILIILITIIAAALITIAITLLMDDVQRVERGYINSNGIWEKVIR